MPDITKGKTFTSGETVTATELNSLVDDAVINNLAINNNKLAADAVTNVKVAAAAAIDWDKMASLASGQILVGNSDNQAAGVAMSGDATINNTGALTVSDDAITSAKLADTGVVSGDYTNASISVDSQGRLTSASTGTPAKIVQVVSASLDSASFNTSSTSMTDITGFSASITPTSASNKILVNVSCTFGGSTNLHGGFGLKRDSAQIGSSDEASGSRQNCISAFFVAGSAQSTTNSFQYMDSPATTSETTYQVTVSTRTGYSFRMNRPWDDDNSDYNFYGISSIILTEVTT